MGGINASGMSVVVCTDEHIHEGVQPGRRCAFISPIDQHNEVGRKIKEEKAITTNFLWILMRKTKQDKKRVSREEAELVVHGVETRVCVCACVREEDTLKQTKLHPEGHRRLEGQAGVTWLATCVGFLFFL